MYLRQFIKYELKSRNLSVYWLARQIGLRSPSSLYYWLSGRRGIDWKTLNRILTLLRVQYFTDDPAPATPRSLLRR
jgi:hypothetical protein